MLDDIDYSSLTASETPSEKKKEQAIISRRMKSESTSKVAETKPVDVNAVVERSHQLSTNLGSPEPAGGLSNYGPEILGGLGVLGALAAAHHHYTSGGPKYGQTTAGAPPEGMTLKKDMRQFGQAAPVAPPAPQYSPEIQALLERSEINKAVKAAAKTNPVPSGMTPSIPTAQPNVSGNPTGAFAQQPNYGAPVPAGPPPSQFDLSQLGQSRDPLAGQGFQQPTSPAQTAPQATPVAPEAAPPAPPASSVAQRTRRNAEQIAADREALLASAPEGRLPSAPNPKKSNKLMPGDVVGQGGWHWYKGQMGPEAEDNWLRTFGRTNVPVKEVQQAMKEGRLAGPVVPEGKQGGSFPREATVPNYIKGRASLGGILSTAAGAGLMATAGSPEGQEAMRRAASAIRDLGVSPDMLMSKGEELGRLGNAYVNAGNQNYRAELQQQIAVEQDPKRLNQLIRELQKTGTVGGGRGVAPPSAYR
jgi:hypothetical protein